MSVVLGRRHRLLHVRATTRTGSCSTSKILQPTQLIPNPIRDRSGQPGITQDVIVFFKKRKTSRSQEISVNSFNEELSSSDRTGRPVETEEIQARSSEDSKSLNVEQTHDRTLRPVNDTVAVQDDPEVHREITTLNTDNELPRERIEEDMDFKIPGLPHSIVKHAQSASVRDFIQKIENHPNRHALQRDLQQSQSFNPFSQESKQMIREVGNIELCELLDMEPKAQCKICLSYWDIGIVYCTWGKGTEENKKFVKYTLDLLSIPNFYIKKGRPHGHRYGKKPGDHEYFTANSLKKKCKKKNFLGSTTGSSATRCSAKKCLTSVALKKYVVRWTNLRTKTTRTTSLQKKFVCTETIGGLVRTQLVLIRCQFGIDLTSSKHCQPCDRSKTKRIQLISKDGKAIPHLGGTGKNPGGILLLSITATMDPALIDQGNL